MPIRRYSGSGFQDESITTPKLAIDAFNVIVVGNVVATSNTYANLVSSPNSYVDISGGYISIFGQGFSNNANVFIDSTAANSVTVISNSQLGVQVPPKTAGLYNLYVVNDNGRTATRPLSLGYSNFPEWVTSSPLGTGINSSYSNTLVATDAVSYSVTAGSSLPPGFSLYSNGLLTTANSGSLNAYSFSITATSSDGSSLAKEFIFYVGSGTFDLSPAVSGKTRWNLYVDGPFSVSTAGTWTITPITAFNGIIKMWGGGGGGAGPGYGGGGGHSNGTLAFAGGVSYTLTVANGGAGDSTANRNSGAGGGASGMEFTSNSLIIMVAGGGGGGYYGSVDGGAGGGSSGQAGPAVADVSTAAGPGTQVSAGTAGSGARRTGSPGSGGNGGAGAGFTPSYAGGTGFRGTTGGTGKYDSSDAGSGGGGAGYFGGGGGGGNLGGAPGAGGSGFVNTSLLTNSTTLTGSLRYPAANSDVVRGTAGDGGNLAGSPGKIYIEVIP